MTPYFAATMASDNRVVIIGAGVFGLSLAYQLAKEGNQNVTVMDRHVPPVTLTEYQTLRLHY